MEPTNISFKMNNAKCIGEHPRTGESINLSGIFSILIPIFRRSSMALSLGLCLVIAGISGIFGAEIGALKASFNAKDNCFEISGKADYPDGALLFVELNYCGQRLMVTRTAVSGRKFTAILAPARKLLPAYYDIKTSFIPSRQETDCLSLPARSEEITVGTSTPETISRESQTTTASLGNVIEKTRLFYIIIIAEYEQKIKGKPGFDIAEWRNKYQEPLNVFRSFAKSIKERRDNYQTVIYPDIESRTLALLNDVQSIYNEMTEQLNNPDKVRDPHTGQKMPAEMLKDMFDQRFYAQQKPLAESIKLKLCLPDEHSLVRELKGIRQLYIECIQNAQTGQEDPARWQQFSGEWVKSTQSARDRMAEMMKGLGQLQKEFPDFYKSLGNITDTLLSFQRAYDSQIKTKSSAPIKDEFAGEFTAIAEQLGYIHLADSR
ncbi:MAG: hypothetical protein V1701_12290 [Planctomycetota bacterium]